MDRIIVFVLFLQPFKKICLSTVYRWASIDISDYTHSPGETKGESDGSWILGGDAHRVRESPQKFRETTPLVETHCCGEKEFPEASEARAAVSHNNIYWSSWCTEEYWAETQKEISGNSTKACRSPQGLHFRWMERCLLKHARTRITNI